jgi:tRNA A-37 threonylcarbamoyl transferase component Bud32
MTDNTKEISSDVNDDSHKTNDIFDDLDINQCNEYKNCDTGVQKTSLIFEYNKDVIDDHLDKCIVRSTDKHVIHNNNDIFNLLPFENMHNSDESNIFVENMNNEHIYDAIMNQNKDLLILGLLKYAYIKEYDIQSQDSMIRNYKSMVELLTKMKIIHPQSTYESHDKNINAIMKNMIKLINNQKNKNAIDEHHDVVTLNDTIAHKTSDIIVRNLHERSKNIYKNMRILRIISNGSYGVVYEVESFIDQKIYALKKIKYNMNDGNKWNIEAKIMSELDHHNIVKYHTSWIDNDLLYDDIYPSDDSKYMYILMELCETNLLKIMNEYEYEHRKTHIYKLFRQILNGVKYLHHNGIIHRDIKPSNILIKVNNDICAKISDYGCSKKINSIDDANNSFIPSSKYIGTINYVAPELDENNTYDSKVDVYSLGIMLYELITDFHDNNDRLNKLSNIHETLSDVGKTLMTIECNPINCLIKKMICIDPCERISIDDAIKEWNTKKVKKYFK